MIRIAVTRAAHQAEEFAALLRLSGFEPVLYPCIEITLPADTSPIDTALQSLNTFDWLIITSANTAYALAQSSIKPDWSQVAVAAVGEKTAEAVREYLSAEIAFIPASYTAQCLAETLPLLPGQRILLPQSAAAGPALADSLQTRGGSVTAIPAYDTGCVRDGEEVWDHLDALTFMSGSAVRCFVERIGSLSVELQTLPAFCIGPSTAQIAREQGFQQAIMSDVFTMDGMMDRIKTHFGVIVKKQTP